MSDLDKKPLLIFTNACGVCKCQDGALFHAWTLQPELGMSYPAHEFGKSRFIFVCSACGARTHFENLPVVTAVEAP